MSKNRFKGRVRQAIENESKPLVFGYVGLPDGWDYFDPMKSRTKDCTYENEEPWLIEIDIMPYNVTSDNHMEKDIKNNIAIQDSVWFRSRFLAHKNVNKHRDLCLKTIGMPCPICDYRKELIDSGYEWSDDNVKNLKPQPRDLYIVIPKNSNVYEEKPYIWDISTYVFADEVKKKLNILEKKQRTKGKFDGFADLEDGYTIELAFIVGKFNGNEFPELSGIEFVDREEQYSWDKVDEMPSLDSLLKFKSYEDLKTEFWQGEVTEEVEEEDTKKEEVDSKPTKTERKSKTIKPNECPNGHEFGQAYEHKECDTCEQADSCLEAM